MYASSGFGTQAMILGLALAISLPAAAQVTRSSVDMAASSGVPEFRDPKTGRIWTPNNVGLVSGPNTPADRAFDPLAQAARVDGVVVQRARITPLGTIPVTAGPTVPIVSIDGASLGAIPEKRWQVVLHLNNNSARTVAPASRSSRPASLCRRWAPACAWASRSMGLRRASSSTAPRAGSSRPRDGRSTLDRVAAIDSDGGSCDEVRGRCRQEDSDAGKIVGHAPP